jgi:hypothetical protein
MRRIAYDLCYAMVADQYVYQAARTLQEWQGTDEEMATTNLPLSGGQYLARVPPSLDGLVDRGAIYPKWARALAEDNEEEEQSRGGGGGLYLEPPFLPGSRPGDKKCITEGPVRRCIIWEQERHVGHIRTESRRSPRSGLSSNLDACCKGLL